MNEKLRLALADVIDAGELAISKLKESNSQTAAVAACRLDDAILKIRIAISEEK